MHTVVAANRRSAVLIAILLKAPNEPVLLRDPNASAPKKFILEIEARFRFVMECPYFKARRAYVR